MPPQILANPTRQANPMSRYSYPHTIENGHGERLTFQQRVASPNGGERLIGDNAVAPGSGPPMHVHHYQDEGLTVRQGRIGFQRLGEPEQFAGPGDTVVFKRGEVHRFWNAGEDELRCDCYVEPPDNFEYFLGAIFESTKQSGNGRPDPFDAAFLTRRYRSEFAMMAIPAPVQQFVFPVIEGMGRLLGKYDKYADAPEPVRR